MGHTYLEHNSNKRSRRIHQVISILYDECQWLQVCRVNIQTPTVGHIFFQKFLAGLALKELETEGFIERKLSTSNTN